MSIQLIAETVSAPGEPLQSMRHTVTALGAEEVLIAITHCGVCRSDWHFLNNDWGDSHYPLVPGHEVVGTVIEIGTSVKQVTRGQREGVSWQVGACLACEWCQAGHEEFCSRIQGIEIGARGGFADRMIVDYQFLYEIPDSIDSAHAAPLLCAGATVFNALKQCNVKPGMRVAILGIGGAGHLAVQFARALGCEVTALCADMSLAEEIKQLGATEVIHSQDKQSLENKKDYFDFILSTIDSDLDYQYYIDKVRPMGQFCFVGIPLKPISLSVFSLVIGQKTVSAVPLGNRAHIREVFQFAAAHNIQPKIELMPMRQANQALEKLVAEKAHFRIVLYND